MSNTHLLRSCGVLLVTVFLLSVTGCSSDVAVREPAPEPEVVRSERIKLKSLWRRSYSADEDLVSGHFRPFVHGDFVYLATNNGQIAKIELESGDEVWKVDLDIPLSTGVAVSDQAVVVVGRSGDVIALDLDGQELWRNPLEHDVIEVPLIDGGQLFIQSSNATIFSLAIATGEEIWRYKSRYPSLTLRGAGQPVVYRGRVLASFDSGHILALDQRTGQRLWERQLQVPRGTNEFQRIVDLDGRMRLHDNMLFVPGYQGYLSAVEAYTGQVLWQKELSSFKRPEYAAGRLYLVESDGHLLMLDYRTGDIRWESDLFEFRDPTEPESVGSYIMLGDMDGLVYMIDKSSAKVVAKQDLGDAPLSFAVTPKIAVIQTANGRIRAFQKPD